MAAPAHPGCRGTAGPSWWGERGEPALLVLPRRMKADQGQGQAQPGAHGTGPTVRCSHTGHPATCLGLPGHHPAVTVTPTSQTEQWKLRGTSPVSFHVLLAWPDHPCPQLPPSSRRWSLRVPPHLRCAPPTAFCHHILSSSSS